MRRNWMLPPRDESKLDLTPMIDVIFQLLIFFVFSLKFLSFEGQLNAYLPPQGPDDGQPPPVDLVNVTFFLEWDPSAKRVTCATDRYDPPGGDPREAVHVFPLDPGVKETVGPDGVKEVSTETTLEHGPKIGRVTYDYAAPDFREIERYLRHRQASHDAIAPGRPLPVKVSFADAVPWQMVVNILDTCTALGITDFSINAQEIDY